MSIFWMFAIGFCAVPWVLYCAGWLGFRTRVSFQNTTGNTVDLQAGCLFWICPDCYRENFVVSCFSPIEDYEQDAGYPRIEGSRIHHIGLYSVPAQVKCRDCHHEFKAWSSWDRDERDSGIGLGGAGIDYSQDGVQDQE